MGKTVRARRTKYSGLLPEKKCSTNPNKKSFIVIQLQMASASKPTARPTMYHGMTVKFLSDGEYTQTKEIGITMFFL